MARPTTLPGIMAPLAQALGVTGLAEALGTSARTLNNWANNVSAMPAIEAGLLADILQEHNMTPMLYTHPNIANGYVASTPEGWVMWTWGLPPAGYAKRTRYKGHLQGLVPAGSEVLCMARTHGWPW